MGLDAVGNYISNLYPKIPKLNATDRTFSPSAPRLSLQAIARDGRCKGQVCTFRPFSFRRSLDKSRDIPIKWREEAVVDTKLRRNTSLRT